ncbi:MAG TPA: cell division protein FtsA, partial [Bacilli bacterium]|nr:cell division protein FtsA [Bacilli bacterium]
MRKIIASIDLGSSTIKIVVAEVLKNKLHVLASSDTHSKGIKNGLVINETDVVKSLHEGIKKIEDMLGLKLNKVIVNVPETDAEFCLGEGITTVTNEEKMVDGKDIVRALQASVYNKVPQTEELVSILPLEFMINEEEVVSDPKKLTANKLSVKTVIATAPKINVHNIIKCFEKLGIEVIDITFGSIGDYAVFEDEELNQKIGAIINLGEDTTTVSIFNKGIITNTEVISIGGANIDNDISFIYKITKLDARRLKENLALAHRRYADASETEEVCNKLGENLKINQYEVTEIVMSRLLEIMNLAKKQINLLTKKEISYIIITGGLTEFTDFSLIIEETFGKNAILGVIKDLGVRNNKYSTALG